MDTMPNSPFPLDHEQMAAPLCTRQGEFSSHKPVAGHAHTKADILTQIYTQTDTLTQIYTQTDTLTEVKTQNIQIQIQTGQTHRLKYKKQADRQTDTHAHTVQLVLQACL